MKEINTLFIYPTDTVWGIGGDCKSFEVYKRISEIKKRSLDVPISILFSNIKEIRQYFSLPNHLSPSFLEEFFKLETTIGLPLKLIRPEKKNSIPPWIYSSSSWVGVRCLDYPWINNLTQLVNGPILTTSLNLRGLPPITSYNEAAQFHKDFAPEAKFVSSQDKTPLSGTPSSIYVLQENETFRILRPGRYQEELEKLLPLQ